MDQSSFVDTKSPEEIWKVFSSLFPTMMMAKHHEVDAFLQKFIKLFETFPQIVCSTDNWPTDDLAITKRRKAFMMAFFRRMVHLSAKSQTGVTQYSQIVGFMLSLIHENTPLIWTEMLQHYTTFWLKLCDASAQSEKDPSVESESCQIFGNNELTDDEMFNDEFNLVLITQDIETVENIQTFMTLIFKEQVTLVENSKIVNSIQAICLKQLQLGEALLKNATLSLLSILRRDNKYEISNWIEESHFVIGLVELIFSGAIKENELKLLEEGWCEYVTSIMKTMQSSQIQVLSTHLVSALKSVDGEVKLSENFQLLLRELICFSIENSYISAQFKNWIFEKNVPNLHYLGSMALAEMTNIVKLKNDNEKVSLMNIYENWKLFMDQIDKRLKEDNTLKYFNSVINKVMIKMLKYDSNIEVEMVRKSTLESITKKMIYSLSSSINDAVQRHIIECLETLVMIGHFWPGSSMLGSEIMALEQIWVGLLSLPWFSQQEGKLLDLKLGDSKDLIIESSRNINWSIELKPKCLQLLSQFSKDVCPR